MLKHCSDEEKLEQNSGKTDAAREDFTRPGNLLLKTKQFQGSCVCLLNMTRPFIRSRKSCTKDCLDQDLSLSPSQLVGLYWFGNGCFHYSIAFSGSRGSKPSRSESTCRIRFCFKKTIIWDYRHVRLLIFVMCTPSSLSCNPYELCVDMFNNEMDSLSLSLCVCGARAFIFAPLFRGMHKHHFCPLCFTTCISILGFADDIDIIYVHHDSVVHWISGGANFVKCRVLMNCDFLDCCYQARGSIWNQSLQYPEFCRAV